MPEASEVWGSSSIFAVDPSIWPMTPNNMRVLTHLHALQSKASIWPSPVEPGRNYNVLGVGFQREQMDWPSYMLWEGFANMVPKEDIDHLVQAMEKLSREPEDPHACLGVRVLLKLLQHLQVALVTQ